MYFYLFRDILKMNLVDTGLFGLDLSPDPENSRNKTLLMMLPTPPEPCCRCLVPALGLRPPAAARSCLIASGTAQSPHRLKQPSSRLPSGCLRLSRPLTLSGSPPQTLQMYRLH